MEEIYGLKNLKEHYNREDISKSYERLRFSNLPGKIEHFIEINLINNIIEEEKPNLILEIAVGPGRLTKDIKLWNKGIGIDFSSNMLNLAKKNVNNKNWKFVKSDIMKMPFKNNYFDMVLNFKLLMHFNKKERKKAYNEISRVLRKNSFFIFDIGNKNYNKPLLIRYLLNFYQIFFGIKQNNKLLPKIYDHLITKDELIKELNLNNFSLVRIYGLHYYNNVVLILLALSKRIKFLSSYIKTYIIELEKNKQKDLDKYGSFIIVAKNEKD